MSPTRLKRKGSDFIRRGFSFKRVDASTYYLINLSQNLSKVYSPHQSLYHGLKSLSSYLV